MNEGLEVNVEIGLCTKEMAKENPIKDFEILIEEYKDKWSKQMYDYFKECLNEITKKLKRLEELEKAFVALSKDDEKAKILLSKEIEKNRVLEIIKDLFDFDFALRFPSNQPMLRITNKRTNEYWEIPIAQEEYNLLKEVML